MTLIEFEEKIDSLFPVNRKDANGDFRIDLKNTFNKYKTFLGNLDTDIQTKINDWTGLYKRINQLTDGITKYVKIYFESAHYTAFMTMYSQLHGLQKLSPVLDVIGTHEIKAGEYLWRGRVFKNNRSVVKDDMFHIPFEKRGFVKTQRYSVHGFPCLYLGTTIHSCWEELGRPKFDDLMISGFRATKNIKLLDMRRPKNEDFDGEKLKPLLLRLPLILACSFVVQEKDENADFKPEYIIPQLLLEDIIHTNSKIIKSRKGKKVIDKTENLTLGIIYTSTKVNNDFNRPVEFFENIAMPAINLTNSKGHCPELKKYFDVTTPTCNEYEELRKHLAKTRLFQGGTPVANQYNNSKMGHLESIIKQRYLQDAEKII